MLKILFISSVFWGLSLLFYRAVLQKFTFHHLNRAYLLLTLTGGVLLPFVPSESASQIPLVVTLDTVTIQVNSAAAPIMESIVEQSIDYGTIFWIVYGIVALFLLWKWAKTIFGIHRMVRSGTPVNLGGVRMLYSEKVERPFSFWKWIFVNDKEEPDPIVIAHEFAHIRGGHSRDKILIQLLAALYWVIPVFRFYRRYINEVHEYIADDYVLQSTSKKKYSYFLLGQTGLYVGEEYQPAMSNHFHSLIKNRITMILKKESGKYHRLWYLPIVLLVFSLGAVVLVSCEEKEKNALVTPDETAKLLDKKAETKAVIDRTIEVVDTIITFNVEDRSETTEIVRRQIDVYKIVDEMPRFKSEECEGLEESAASKKQCADNKMLQFIYQNITYPSTARLEGRGGMVVLGFVVDDEGHLIEPEILRSQGDDIDNAVLDMFKKMQQQTWIPGKQDGKNVAVSFILPVRFKLQ